MAGPRDYLGAHGSDAALMKGHVSVPGDSSQLQEELGMAARLRKRHTPMANDRLALMKMANDPEAAKFSEENPDAGAEDYAAHKREKDAADSEGGVSKTTTTSDVPEK